MFNRSVGWFRDVTRFCILLAVYQALLAAGYGRDQGQNAGTSPPTPVSQLLDKTRAANPLAAKPALSSKIQQLGLVVDFRAVISVSRTQSALSVGTVTNNTLTITYSVFNLRADPVNGVLLTTTLQSGVTFQSAVPMPEQSGEQLVFSLVRIPPLSLDVATAEGASEC